MDIIYIHGLEIKTIIGVFEWERKHPQSLLLDIDLACDFTAAIDSDKLEHSVDYTAVAKLAETLASSHQFQLLESFAQHLANAIFNTFAVYSVRLKIHKPAAIANAAGTGVIIERQRD